MPGRNLFRKPFDEGTKTKLALFEGYLLEWLPVFLAPRNIIWRTINIFDFFAGEGYDSTGYKGSPIIILENIRKYEGFIKSNNLKVNVYLNEYDKNKFKTLQQNLADYGEVDYINVVCDNKDFKDIFKVHYSLIKSSGSANLVFLDQNGIKQINQDVFLQLISASTTDVLFFISSSFFARFSEHEAFIKHLLIKQEDLANNNYYSIHRSILNYYKTLIPTNVQYYLAPFSIKKISNIYGLIFGTHHTLGIEKFLNQSWKLDKVRGEANFDIDNDNHTVNQMDMFANKVVGPKKVESFENELKRLIIAKELKTNYQVYVYALTNGFLPRHVNTVLKKLRAENIIKGDCHTLSSDIHKIKDVSKQTLLKT